MKRPQCWVDGIGWIDYPIRVPRVRAVMFTDTPAVQPMDDYLAIVWSGPAAPRPVPPHQIRRALLLWVSLPEQYARNADYLTWLTGFYERQNDCVLWLAEVQHKPSGMSVVRWKRWDR